jgi:hypothetical protein
MELVCRLLPQADVVLRNCYETPDSQFEHDGLLVAHRALVSVEAKTAEMADPSRDPSRSFERLSQQFKGESGIQDAFEQSQYVLNLIRSATALRYAREFRPACDRFDHAAFIAGRDTVSSGNQSVRLGDLGRRVRTLWSNRRRISPLPA